MSKQAWTVFISACLLAFVGGIYGYQMYFFPSQAIPVIAVDNCQLHLSACKVTLPDGETVNFIASPDGLPQLRPLQLSFTVSNPNIQHISVHFYSDEAIGSLLPFPMKKVSLNHFEGNGMLSICTLESMDWIAKVTIETDKNRWQVNFPFKTFRANAVRLPNT